MSESSTISDLVRAAHEACNAKFNDLEQIAESFNRGDKIYCARVETSQVSIRHGIINRIFYQNKEILFSVSPNDTKNADFTISTKSWKIFAIEQDLYDYLHTCIGEDSEVDPEVNVEPQG